MRPIIFSGIQPTGKIHLGNYLGAIKNWLAWQDKASCIFGIVDYHAITVPYEAKKMQDNIMEAALDYLSAGLDPKKSLLIIQSHIPEHTELAWLLNTITPVSWLERVPTFKEKKAQHKYPSMGLMDYPVLMAADILIYKSDLVPVGEDQLPHIELAKQIAKKFNDQFGETFPLPGAELNKGSKIMGLDKPKQKMSKSLGPQNYIALTDPPEIIRKKIQKAVTDSGKEIKPSLDKPAITNLFNIYCLLSEKKEKEVIEHLQGMSYSQFKKELAEVIISSLEDFRIRKKELSKNLDKVKNILGEGAVEARKIARQTLDEVKKKMGLL